MYIKEAKNIENTCEGFVLKLNFETKTNSDDCEG